MTPEMKNLARRRLWLGITNVGFWVLTTSLGLYWLTSGHTSGFDLRRLGFIFVAMIAVQALFDFIGGILLMPEPRPTITAFLHRWSRGVLVHTLVLTGVGFLSYVSFRLSGGFCFAILLATAGLALGRRQLFRAMDGVPIKETPHDGGTLLVANTTDPAFTGGIVGFGRRAKSLIPERWLANLPKEELGVESGRRQWQLENGLPDRAFILVLGWNLIGGFFGSLIFKLAERTPAEALLGHAPEIHVPGWPSPHDPLPPESESCLPSHTACLRCLVPFFVGPRLTLHTARKNAVTSPPASLPYTEGAGHSHNRVQQTRQGHRAAWL